MTKKLHFFLFIITLSISSYNFAQLDGSFGNKKNNNSSSFGNIPATSKDVKKPTSLDFKNNDGFKTAHTKQQKDLKKKQAERDLENKGILTKAKIAEQQYLKSFQKINGMYNYPVIDQDLGSFSTKSKNVNIICRDFQYPDGDQVMILVNNIPVVSNLTLKQNYQSFNIPLDEGINTIEIIALNQGSSGPNTAGFKIFNDAGMLISSNQWNLATGAKASIIIAKQKD
ncbi:hypothetical protein H0I31_01315 [Tenacibaculum sp. AHE15PA]|uniref:hypothetical protein n=1 Tax=unclassified Tenacibaculum TaxID=2635139 RepID=UPI001C4F7FA8|nr:MULTISPECIES: hypothetical protein [unclassified Tenacibaculum]QXP72374.1 hypothetical protein H0I30_06575 [Tenacibaculum sp. AHE14PA]QXP76289.1 hypothetical protein H0I31_01315 [Tenacibaculum sp. AHE15PA]